MWRVTAVQRDGATSPFQRVVRAQGSGYALAAALLRGEGHSLHTHTHPPPRAFFGWCLWLQVVDADETSNFKPLQRCLGDISSAAATEDSLIGPEEPAS